MQTFRTKGPRMIYIPRIGHRVFFDDEGLYRTNDEQEIQALGRSRNVENVKGSGLIRSKDESRGGDSVNPKDYSREELDRLAIRVGVQEPDKLPNKAAVADAINEAG